MQKYLIPLGLGIALVILSAYLLTILNPFDESAAAILISSQSIKSSVEFIELVKELTAKGLIFDYLNIKNVLIITATGASALICLFFAFHLTIDKLFVKKFYEQPSIFTAARRSVLFALAVVGSIASRVYGGEWYYALVWTGLMLVIELLLWKVFQKPAVEVTGEGEDSERKLTFFQKHTQGLSFDPRNFPRKFKAAVERFNLRNQVEDNDVD